MAPIENPTWIRNLTMDSTEFTTDSTKIRTDAVKKPEEEE
jgi:formylmethanofuran dehydrogenase subunit E-like metal-binding protein